MGRWRVSSGCTPKAYGTGSLRSTAGLSCSAGPPVDGRAPSPGQNCTSLGRRRATAPVRVWTPSLANTFSRCLRTVPGRDPELPGDLGVRHALGHEHDDFVLPRCQPAAHAVCVRLAEPQHRRARDEEDEPERRRRADPRVDPVEACAGRRLHDGRVVRKPTVGAIVGPQDDVALRCGCSARTVRRTIVGAAGAFGDHPVVRLPDGARAVRRAVVGADDRVRRGRSAGDDERGHHDRRADCEPLECRVKHGSSSVR